jgi:uncharacterized membrane protein (UPF0182 family)
VLWFDELGQPKVLRGILTAKIEFYLFVVGVVALFIGGHLRVALRKTRMIRTTAGSLVLTAASLVIGTMFASAVQGHWQTFLLWQHRQPFGVTDPIHGRDVGYFVFSLPFERLVSGTLLWLIVVAAYLVVMVYRARQAIGVRPLRATFNAQLHLAVLAAMFLLVVAWRLQLKQYTLELGQASPHDSQSFSGAGYVDVHVRLPGLEAMTVGTVVFALVCLAAPFVARRRSPRTVRWFLGVPVTLLVVGVAAVGGLIPALVQRYIVDPNPLLSEQPYLERSIAATRKGLGLEAVDVAAYSPTESLTAADYPQVSKRLGNVLIWDSSLLEARMRQLVSDTPYFSPQESNLDPVRVKGRRQLTVVSARELDLDAVADQAQSWSSDRLGYTHGLGLVRFSGTDVEQSRQPRLLSSSLHVSQPRIYFGNQPQEPPPAPDEAAGSDSGDPTGSDQGAPRNEAPTTSQLISERLADLPWVVVDTRRPEVDIPAPEGGSETPYHYDGTGGVELSNWVRRAIFAVALGSKELFLSDDITPESRILLHRDVHERLLTLAPFIQWDSDALPLTSGGRIVYVVDGYTTSNSYPYAESAEIAGVESNYARASVRATVDAFSGKVDLYLTDPSDPIAQAWVEIFPTLFRPEKEMPADIRDRIRYPADLFDAQATAYETFHTTRPDVFVSDSDAWSRPIGLSGSLEVAGGLDFDESDEDDLRLILGPGYKLTPPPGSKTAELVLQTYYVPSKGQNLVANLSGWIDEHGRARLAARNLPRDPVTLGPAQISRLVFATPRVSNLLGLKNLETTDVDKSSIDAVLLGIPHLLFLPEGIIQIQSLYEGSRGPGAARLLGVTAYLNGRAGLGPDIESAVRQALNEPPRIVVRPPDEPAVVGKPVKLEFQVENAQREVVTITSTDGSLRRRREVATGQGTVRWVPSTTGEVRVRVDVDGLDGTTISARTTFSVLSAPPTVRLIDPPTKAVVGEPLVIPFQVTHALDAVARVSTLSGIEFRRRYLIRDGTALVEWTPKTAGKAELLITVNGGQGQMASKKLQFDVAPSPEEPVPPTVTLDDVPDVVTVGIASEFSFSADGCRVAVARIRGPGGEVRNWRFPCPASRATFTWTPTTPGDHVLTVIARVDGISTKTSTMLSAEAPP